MTETNHQVIQDFYISYRTTIMGWAKKRGMSTVEAEDMVHDVFMRLLRTDKMISQVTLPALAYQVFSRLWLATWRHRKCVEQHEHYLIGQSCSTDGLSVISAHETTLLLERGLARLEEKACRILRMNIEEDKKVSEIAKTLDMKYKTVEYKLYFARKDIRQYMRKALS